jgi:dipeptidyl aminopeptidase/acylaminoacyl peptidase
MRASALPVSARLSLLHASTAFRQGVPMVQRDRLSTLLSWASLASFALAACGGGAPPAPATPPPLPPTSSVATTTNPPPPPSPATNDPTALTDEQRQRDRALAPRAAALVDAYANSNGIFTSLVAQLTRDKKHFLFGSMRDGAPEVYLGEVAKPGDPPRALTTGPERAEWATLTVDDKYVLYTRDEGADENWRIWRVGLDGSGATDLTPGDKMHRDEPVLPRGKPSTMIYTAHVATSPGSQLFVQDLGGTDARKVYDDPSPAFVADATRDGGRALLVRWNSASDEVLVEIDVAGAMRGDGHGAKPPSRFYPPEGSKATINAATYSPDGKIVYVATDEGKEGFSLLALDVQTQSVKRRYVVEDPATANIGNLQVSPRGDRLAVLVDAGNHSEIRVLDARKLTLQRTVKTPLGLANIGPFTHDGKSFSFWQSTFNHPADPFLADAATGATTKLRDDKRPGLDALTLVVTSIEKVPAFDGLTLPVNLYLPVREGGTRLPTLVVFHGGPSSSSAIRWNPTERFFASLGYAIVEPNIRGSTGFGRAYEMADNREKRAGVLEDMAAINAWAKAQPWCDANRVVVFGGSYGGYVTLMALTRQPERWRAGVDLFGIADLKSFLKTTSPMIRTAFVDEFGDLDKDAALLEEYSPSRAYDKIVAPLFVYAGQNDPRVPRSESDQIVVALRSRSVPVEYMVAADEGHSIDRRENKIELMTRVARFLGDQMK